MKVLIIEDELLVAKKLESLVLQIEPAAQLIGPLTSVQMTLDWLSKNSLPDLILSDIQLSDGISFEIFEKSKISCPVIFTTAYDEYAIRAFKLNSIDYLLKPVDLKELQSAMFKYKNIQSSSAVTMQLAELLSKLKGESQNYKERFLTQQRNSLVPITVDEIALFQKQELIYLFTFANEKLISDHSTLDEIESLLDPAKFFRVNRQHLIHIQSVSRVKATHKGMTVVLKAPFNLELDLSREKVTALKKWLGE
jgi:two-component system LytT family response regulator